MWMPPAASGPVLTVIRPILSGAFCATAGIGNAAAPAAAAVDRRNLRRLMRVDMLSSLVVSCHCFGVLRTPRNDAPLLARLAPQPRRGDLGAGAQRGELRPHDVFGHPFAAREGA